MDADPRAPAQASSPVSIERAASEAAIRQGLVEGARRLLCKARYYLHRFGLASADAAEELARDAIQDVARRALEGAGRYRPAECPVYFWLEGILLNVVRQIRDERLRHVRVYPGGSGDQESMLDGEDFDRFLRLAGLAGPTDPEARAAAREELSLGLGALSAADREVLELSVIHEMDYDEIAVRLGVTPGAARVRRSRALTRLRRALPQKGGRP